MTDLAGALADTTHLTEYRGREVRKTKVTITNAGDGLSEALGIEPQEFEQGDEVFVLLRTVVGSHKLEVMKGYDPDEGDAPLVLVQQLRAQDATVVTKEFADRHIKAQRVKIQRAKDEAEGKGRLDAQPGAEGWDDEHAEMDAEDGEPNGNVHPFPSNGGVTDASEDSDTGTDDAESERGLTDDEGYYDPQASTAPGPDDSPL